MTSIFKSAGMAAFLLLSVANCAPTNQPARGVDAAWPNADQNLTKAALREIESRLRIVGCFNGTVDGNVTRKTREAIKCYQDKVGQRPNGVVSAALLKSLRGAGAAQLANSRPESDLSGSSRPSGNTGSGATGGGNTGGGDTGGGDTGGGDTGGGDTGGGDTGGGDTGGGGGGGGGSDDSWG